jgi:hypothetical protein
MGKKVLGGIFGGAKAPKPKQSDEEKAAAAKAAADRKALEDQQKADEKARAAGLRSTLGDENSMTYLGSRALLGRSTVRPR